MFSQNGASSAQQQAYAFVREMILSGKYKAGTLLKPAVIGEEIGISRMPVREAIRQLDSEGFVRIRPNRSAIVVRLSPDDMLELFEMRSVLEGLAARIAVPLVNPGIIEDLEQLNIRMTRAADDLELWIARHEDFHSHLVGITGRFRLMAQTKNLRHAIQPYFRLFMTSQEKPQLGEHEMVIQAVASGDPELAAAVVRNHVIADTASMLEFLQRNLDGDNPA